MSLPKPALPTAAQIAAAKLPPSDRRSVRFTFEVDVPASAHPTLVWPLKNVIHPGFDDGGRGYGGDIVAHPLQPLEHVGEDLVELVDVLLVFHEGGAGEVVEIVDRTVDDHLVQALHEHEVFLQRHRHLGLAKLGEETHEHAGLSRATNVCLNAEDAA